MKTILFFGSEKGFEKWNYDILYFVNIQFQLCTRFEQIRGIEFHGYVLHYSASKDLQKEINQNYELLEQRIRKFTEKESY